MGDAGRAARSVSQIESTSILAPGKADTRWRARVAWVQWLNNVHVYIYLAMLAHATRPVWSAIKYKGGAKTHRHTALGVMTLTHVHVLLSLELGCQPRGVVLKAADGWGAWMTHLQLRGHPENAMRLRKKLSPKWHHIAYIVQYFGPGLWSKLVHSIGNRMCFGMQPVRVAARPG